MRAETQGKREMGKRFAVVIGVAAVGVIALGAQTAAQTPAPTPPAPAVVKYDTKLMITHEGGCWSRPTPSCVDDDVLWHGAVETDRTECMGGRRVILFKQQPGADRKLGATKSKRVGNWGEAGELIAPQRGRVYARISPKVGDGFVCRADRSRTVINGNLCPWSGPEFCNPPTPAPTPPGQPPPGRCQEATIIGTEGPDQITGTAASDVIAALGGNDTVTALAANDAICGGPGRDVLRGGQGNDTLFGEAGKDVLYGGEGKDICGGGKGAFGCER